MGGNGDDTLIGGAGFDLLMGGAGKNKLVQEGSGVFEGISTFRRTANGWSRTPGSGTVWPESWLLDYLVDRDLSNPNNPNYGISIKI